MDKPKAKAEYQNGRLVVAVNFGKYNCDSCVLRKCSCYYSECTPKKRDDSREVIFVTPQEYLSGK